MWRLFKVFSALKVSEISHIKILHHGWPSNAPTSLPFVMLCLFKKCIIHYFSLESSTVEWLPHQHQWVRLNSSVSVSMIGSFPNPIMCEGWGHEVRLVFCWVIKITKPAFSLFFFPLFSPFVIFFHWRERQRFPTLVNFFVSLCTVHKETMLPCSWMHNLVSLSFLCSRSPSRASPLRPFSHLTAPLPPPPPLCVSPVLPTSQRSSHLTLPYFISLPLFFPFIWPSSLTSCPFLSHLSLLPWFADSWETEHKSIPFITPRCTLHNPKRLFPLTLCKGTHTDSLRSTLNNWHTHAPDKQVNNPLPENSVWILN